MMAPIVHVSIIKSQATKRSHITLTYKNQNTMESIKSQFYQHVKTVKGEAFANELNEVLPFFDNVSLPSKKKARLSKKRDPTKPKRPISAYIAFSVAKRPEVKAANPEKTTTEILSLLAACWRNASDEEKEDFVQIAKENKVRYLEKMTEWRKTNAKQCLIVESDAEDNVSLNVENTVNVTKKPRGRIVPFAAFLKAKRPEVKAQNPGKTTKEVTTIIRLMWKDTPIHERLEYKEIAAKDKVRYETEMTAWKAIQQQQENTAVAEEAPATALPEVTETTTVSIESTPSVEEHQDNDSDTEIVEIEWGEEDLS